MLLGKCVSRWMPHLLQTGSTSCTNKVTWKLNLGLWLIFCQSTRQHGFSCYLANQAGLHYFIYYHRGKVSWNNIQLLVNGFSCHYHKWVVGACRVLFRFSRGLCRCTVGRSAWETKTRNLWWIELNIIALQQNNVYPPGLASRVQKFHVSL